MRRARSSSAVVLLSVVGSACGPSERPVPSPSPSAAARPSPTATRGLDPFDAWLRTDFPPADGFAVAGRVDEPTVRSMAHGRVALARDCGPQRGQVVAVDHVFYENHERRTIESLYARLSSIAVRAGDVIGRGDPIG